MTAFAAVHLWQSTLVLLAAWLITFCYRRNAAEVRFLIWFGASMKFLAPLAALQWLGDQLGQSLPRPLAVDPQLIESANALFTPSLPAAMALTEASTVRLAVLAMSLWACGVLLLSWRWFQECRITRAIIAASWPLPLDLPVPVRVTRDAVTPGVVGILQPVVILPQSVLSMLAPQQLAAVLAHELCHVRRRDNLLAALHRCVATLFWFHPLVWWLGARLLQEREAACDECVIEEGHGRQIYAQSILEVCRVSVAARLGAIGAAAGDLRQRICGIMSKPEVQPLDGARFALLLAGISCVCFAPLFSGFAGGANRAASADAEPVSFDRFTLHSTARSLPSRTHFDAAAGQLTLQSVSLRGLIGAAYPAAIVGGDPYVIDHVHYDIQATWRPRAPITERAAYRELLRQTLPGNVQLLVDGKCEMAC